MSTDQQPSPKKQKVEENAKSNVADESSEHLGPWAVRVRMGSLFERYPPRFSFTALEPCNWNQSMYIVSHEFFHVN